VTTPGQAHVTTTCHESVPKAGHQYPLLRAVPGATGGRSSSIPGCRGLAPEEGQPAPALARAEPWVHDGHRNEEDLHATLELRSNPADSFAILAALSPLLYHFPYSTRRANWGYRVPSQAHNAAGAV
jgi:hypothetical protein